MGFGEIHQINIHDISFNTLSYLRGQEFIPWIETLPAPDPDLNPVVTVYYGILPESRQKRRECVSLCLKGVSKLHRRWCFRPPKPFCFIGIKWCLPCFFRPRPNSLCGSSLSLCFLSLSDFRQKRRFSNS